MCLWIIEPKAHLSKICLWNYSRDSASKGAPFDPWEPTLLLLTVVLLRVLLFLPTIPPLGGVMPPMNGSDKH